MLPFWPFRNKQTIKKVTIGAWSKREVKTVKAVKDKTAKGKWKETVKWKE